MSVGYQPNGSNYHDHLCNCPGCNYDGPEPTDAEIQEWEEDMQEIIVIPVLDPIEHTEVSPFCSDPLCPCREDRYNINTLNELVEQGLLTKYEAKLVMRGAMI